METLEERAKLLMNTLPCEDPKGLVYEAYKKGATEQKAIDDAERDTAVYNLLQLKLDNEKKLWLAKACERLMKQYAEDDMDMVSASAFIWDFRKAMEE